MPEKHLFTFGLGYFASGLTHFSLSTNSFVLKLLMLPEESEDKMEMPLTLPTSLAEDSINVDE